MSIVILEVKAGGRVLGRCDSKCYNAEGPDCHCICGGANHGVGSRIAIDDREHLTDDELLLAIPYELTSPDLVVVRPLLQKELF